MMTAGAASASSEQWSGQGALFGRDGAQIGTYRLDLTNTEVSPGEARSDVVVTTADGQVLKFSQVMRKDSCGNGFIIVGDTGNGGGYCFGEGLCQIYLEQTSGTAYAITLARDGDDQMRFMKTELENGQVTRFFREKLNRVQ